MTSRNTETKNARTFGPLSGLALAIVALFTATSSRADPAAITFGLIQKSGSSAVVYLLERDVELQKKHNIKVAIRHYPGVAAMYSGMETGEYHATVGGAAAFATRAKQGVPVRLISTFTYSSTQLLGKREIKSAEDLRGKRITAVQGTLWNLVSKLISDKYKLSSGKDYEVVRVPNTLTGVTQVLAGTADYAWGWEPDTTLARGRFPDLKLALTVDDMRASAEPSLLQVIAAHSILTPEAESNLIAALAEIGERIRKDPAPFNKLYAEVTGTDGAAITDAIAGGRYTLTIRPLTDKDAAAVEEDLRIIEPDGKPLPSKFLRR